MSSAALTHPQAGEMYPPPADLLTLAPLLLPISDREEMMKELEHLALCALMGGQLTVASLLSCIRIAMRAGRALELLGTVRYQLHQQEGWRL